MNADASEREWAETITVPEGAVDTDHPLAKFGDEYVTVKSLTVKQYKAMEEGRRKAKAAVLWEGKLASDATTKLSIKRKPDRTPLLILFKCAPGEKEKQLCQVALKVFGDVEAKDLWQHR